MSKKIVVNNSELPIMRVLWKKDGITSPEILAELEGNRSTLKTLLLRLVERGAVRTEEINKRNNRYYYVVSEADYIEGQRKTFIQRVFNGSPEKMLLNFVKEEKISAETLKQLIDIIEEE